MTYLIADNKPIVYSENELFLYDCEEALTKKGYQLTHSEEQNDKDNLQYEIYIDGKDALGRVSLPSVALIIIDYAKKEHHTSLKYSFVARLTDDSKTLRKQLTETLLEIKDVRKNTPNLGIIGRVKYVQNNQDKYPELMKMGYHDMREVL